MSDDDPLRKLLFPDNEVTWQVAKMENDALPREPGRYKVGVAGPPRPTTPFDFDCPDCGGHFSSRGGIAFGTQPACEMHPDMDDCIPIHIHWMSCPSWKHRLWRLWHHHTWGQIVRRWKSYKWRRRAKKERADPNAWVKFWSQGGK